MYSLGGRTVMRSNWLPRDKACLLILVAVDLTGQTADPLHHFSILCRRHFGDCTASMLVCLVKMSGKGNTI
jgi:hypothetical protein